MEPFYLTTPLYYVNAKPHLGHAYTTIAADCLARFHRLMGRRVYFLTGTDEHGQKVERSSREAGLEPRAFTDRISGVFVELWKTLDIQYDDFIRTTEARHIRAVQAVWKELHAKGLIYRTLYKGWYCTPCETFLGERDLSGEKLCPQCHRPLEALEEDNFFFGLSRYQDWLLDFIRSHPGFILPETRSNEILSFLEKSKLSDLCISRPRSRLGWGIDCPLSKDHVTYVWFDALVNYISALGFPDRKNKLKEYWPCRVHLIGKDILRPHAVTWPILLKALDLEPPHRIFAHGWWIQGPSKMSKSLGNVLDPLEVVQEFGVDGFRYFLLREVPFGMDGTYSPEAIRNRFNTDLANDLGNLHWRTLTMLEKYFEGWIEADPAKSVEHPLRKSIAGLPVFLEKSLEGLAFHEALTHIWECVNAANKYIEDSAPWALHRDKKQKELLEVMGTLMEVLRVVAQAVWPFLPWTGEKIWISLGLKAEELVSEDFRKIPWNYFKKRTRIQKTEPLFPRIL